MAKPATRQPELVKHLLKDPLTGRMVCGSCFDGIHNGCRLESCECMHKDVKPAARPKKKKNEGQQTIGDVGSISV